MSTGPLRAYKSKISRLLGLVVVPCLLVGAADAREHQQRDDPPRAANNRQLYDHPAYQFRTEDGERLYSHYKSSGEWRDRHDRHEYYEGQRLEGDWQSGMRPIPQDYTRELSPLPQGYVFGYSDGYAVAYNPATHIVADVIDLAATATQE